MDSKDQTYTTSPYGYGASGLSSDPNATTTNVYDYEEISKRDPLCPSNPTLATDTDSKSHGMASSKTSSTHQEVDVLRREIHSGEVQCARYKSGTVEGHSRADTEHYNAVLDALTALKINSAKPTKGLKTTGSEYLKECYALPGGQPAWKRKGTMYLEHGQAQVVSAAGSIAATAQKTTAKVLHKVGELLHPSHAPSTDAVTDSTDVTASQTSAQPSVVMTKGKELLKQGQVVGAQVLHKIGEKMAPAPADTTSSGTEGSTTTPSATYNSQPTDATSTGVQTVQRSIDTESAPHQPSISDSAMNITETPAATTATGEQSALKVKAKEFAKEGGSALKAVTGSLLTTMQQKGSELLHKAGSKMEATEVPSVNTTSSYSSSTAPTSTSQYHQDQTSSVKAKGENLLHQGANVMHQAADKVDPATTYQRSTTSTGVTGRDYSQ